MEEIFKWAVYIVASMLITSIFKKTPRQEVRGVESDISHATPLPVPGCDCWTVLGIEPTANHQEIKRAYRTLVKQYHPDVAGHSYNLKCARITEAYREALKSA